MPSGSQLIMQFVNPNIVHLVPEQNFFWIVPKFDLLILVIVFELEKILSIMLVRKLPEVENVRMCFIND